MNYILRIYKKGKMCRRLETANKRRFFNQTGTIPWQNRCLKVYLKVIYGKFIDNFGKKTLFMNEGDYTNKKDFMLALKAFTEK
jgi:hypothetical protein